MNPEDIKQRMADVFLPAPPTNDSLVIVIAIVMVSAITLFIIAYGWRRHTISRSQAQSDTSSALQQLEQIKQDWLHHVSDSRETAYRLANVLRLGLALPQLNATPPNNTIKPQHWQNTVHQLNALRYPENNTVPLPDELFSKIERLLTLAHKS